MNKITLLASAGCLLAAAPAWGQDAPPLDDSGDQPAAQAGDAQPAAQPDPDDPSNILVTARRTEERLRDVPLAITALTGRALDEQGVRTVHDLAKVSAGLSVTRPNTDPFSPVVSMRGQVQNDITLLSLDTSVGFYVDDFYISRPNALTAFGTYDLQRIEVSRGPQGTLFGRNATGGNVRYITRKAGGDFEGYLRGAYGNFHRVEMEGALNVPIIGDRLAVRVSGLRAYDRGYSEMVPDSVRNALLAQTLAIAPNAPRAQLLPNPRAYGDTDSTSVRVNVVARPVDAVTLDLSWNHFDGESGNQASRITIVGALNTAPYAPWGTTALGLRYQTLSSAPHFANATNDLYTAALRIDLAENIQFNAVLGQMDIEVDQQFDLVPLGIVSNPLSTSISSRQRSAEARLSGNFLDNRLNLQAGAYFLRERGITDLRQTITEAFAAAAGFTSLTVQALNTGRNRSSGFFAQGTFEITPQLRLTLGGRYTDEHREITSLQQRYFTPNRVVGGVTIPNPVCTLNTANGGTLLLTSPTSCTFLGVKDDNYFSYLASLDFRPNDDHLFYIKTARSYRAGGFNPRGTDVLTFVPFEPESVTEYEVGYHGRLFDRLDLNVALFYDQRRNGQQSRVEVVGGVPITLIGNDVNVNIFGQEIEATLRIAPGFSVDAMFTHLNKRLQLSPATRLNFGATFRQPVGDGTLTARASYSWQSDFDGVPSGCRLSDDFRNCPVAAGQLGYSQAANNVASYGLLNARIAYQLNSPNIEFALFARNIANTYYDTFKFDARSSGAGVGYTGQPRTYGFEVRFNF